MRWRPPPYPCRRYLLAMQFALAQLLTVGSPITAYTDMETFFVIGTQAFAGVSYAYLIGTMCSIFALKTKKQTAFYEAMDELNLFLGQSKLTSKDATLCTQLRMFYQYNHHKADPLVNVLGKLSPALRANLAWRVHSDWLLSIDLFSNLELPKKLYVTVALQLESILVSPLEAIIGAS